MLLRAPHARRRSLRRRGRRWRSALVGHGPPGEPVGPGDRGPGCRRAQRQHGHRPAPASGEGALVAAGWSIVHLGSAGDATFSSAGPSLAPVHLGGWIWATALGRASSAIAAGREAMLAPTSSASRSCGPGPALGLARWAAGGAALVFAVSPLAVAPIDR